MAIGKFYVELTGDSVSGAQVLSLAVICAKTFFHLHHLSFIPLCAPTSALRAPPSKGRRDRYTQNAPHSSPFLWKGLSSEARRGWLPPYVGNAFPPYRYPHHFRTSPFIKINAERRSGALINDVLETLFPALFHAACALSAPSGHLPLEGKAAIREYHLLKKGGEAATSPLNLEP